MVYIVRCSAKLPCSKSFVHTLHLATTGQQHVFGTDVHAQWDYDANRDADRPAPSLVCAGLYQISGRATGGRVERSGQDLGCLQSSRPTVCSDSIYQHEVSIRTTADMKQMHSVATGYGLPPATVYDWTLSPPADATEAKNLRLPDEIEARLRIEKFCDKVTKRLYGNDRDPVGLASEEQRAVMASFLARDFDELERQLGTNISGRFSQCAWSV